MVLAVGAVAVCDDDYDYDKDCNADIDNSDDDNGDHGWIIIPPQNELFSSKHLFEHGPCQRVLNIEHVYEVYDSCEQDDSVCKAGDNDGDYCDNFNDDDE
ncbi:hypothetical protein DPMN_031965 [Dreissena polymorpha]|uniref:Uncharacterized protein n=1 Tax=Dreissena polymorpha TaxID=45954 RepID=A0A9D4M5M2_DREPO|nr:hypothetical protein DPMN_031965 [Dreissena polymorpha]